MVVGILKLISLIKKRRIENKVHFLVYQPVYMSVGQLGRITFRLTGNGFNAQLINFPVGDGGEDYPVPQLREEGEPEGIIFIHIEDPGNSHTSAFGLVCRKRLISKNTF